MLLFEKTGKQNTEETIRIAYLKARDEDIREIIIASCTGYTAGKALEVFNPDDRKIIIITSHAGFTEPFRNDMEPETIEALRSRGIHLLTCSHALSGIERSFRQKHGGLYPAEIAAETLRIFGHGVKVCVEMSIMAADAGLLSGKPCICIGGTGHGADAAAVITPSHMNTFLDTRVHEILCKPRL